MAARVLASSSATPWPGDKSTDPVQESLARKEYSEGDQVIHSSSGKGESSVEKCATSDLGKTTAAKVAKRY